MSIERRMRYARRIRWPSDESCVTSSRKRGTGTARTSPASRTTAVTNTAWPVSRFSSPRKRPGPWTLITVTAFLRHVPLNARDPPRQNHEEVAFGVALPEEKIALTRRSSLSVRGERFDLFVGQGRVSAVDVG